MNGLSGLPIIVRYFIIIIDVILNVVNNVVIVIHSFDDYKVGGPGILHSIASSDGAVIVSSARRRPTPDARRCT